MITKTVYYCRKKGIFKIEWTDAGIMGRYLSGKEVAKLLNELTKKLGD